MAEVGRDGYMCRRLVGDLSECALDLWEADNDIVNAAVLRLVGMTLWRLEQQVRSCALEEETFDWSWD